MVVYRSVYVVCFDISFNLVSSDFYNFNVFSGIPGCAKSALCKELLNAPGGFADDRPVHTLMGDLVKGILECRVFWSKLLWSLNFAMPSHAIFYILDRKILAKGC